MEDRLSAIANQMRSSTLFGGAASIIPLRVHLVTMGCAKNEVDSADMASKLLDYGCVVADEPDDADCIIVNTCSFIQAATEESIEAVFDMCGLDNVRSGDAKVVVAGCMPSRYGNDLRVSLPEVRTFVPCSKEDNIVGVVAELFPGRLAPSKREGMASEASVYVKISDGCDRFCSFCTIPFIRGRYRSFTFGQINADVSRAVASGAREVVLIAQDTGRWGNDFSDPSSLSWLLSSLARKHPHTWFRVMYIQPEGVTDDLLDVIARYDNIVNYIDVPFQHASQRLLASMNRTGSGREYLALLERVRERVPGITVRTTLIAGYPGETEEEFNELCEFVEEAEFDYVGVFPYSQEEGTRAARLDSQIDEDEKLERAARLRDIADSISYARVAQRIGERVEVLVLGREEDGQLYGRARMQAPDVDGVVYLSEGDVGDVVDVVIGDTLMYDMESE